MALPDIHFDEALAALIRVGAEHTTRESLGNSVVFRDAVGRLALVLRDAAPSDEARSRLNAAVEAAIGAYARAPNAVMFAGDPGVEKLLIERSATPFRVNGFQGRMVDRRIVGSGWLDDPAALIVSPPKVVFFSLKGGVGRTTALTIAAADFARRQRNVLLVDLDLEAPGLGAFLLDDQRLPEFGVLDYLVEAGVGNHPSNEVDRFIGTSTLTVESGGRVDVAPALGRNSLKNPENVLPKIGRALLDGVSADGDIIPLRKKFTDMIAALGTNGAYDVVLIDARAGLSELAAPLILGVGEIVLLFGADHKQTLDGYRALLAALKPLAERDILSGGHAEWRSRLKLVQAKAPISDPDTVERFRDDMYELFAEFLYDEESASSSEPQFAFDIDDLEAPHSPLVIGFDPKFANFQPAREPSQLTAPFYEQAFRPFLDGLDGLIAEPAVADSNDSSSP